MALASIVRGYGLTQTGAPASEPVTQAEAKLWMRVTQADQDDVVDHLIAYAREAVEDGTDRQLITATWKMYLDAFADLIYVPKAPLASVTSIAYVDGDGDTQTLTEGTDFLVDTDHDPGRITPFPATVWPGTRVQTQAVTITFTAGFGSTAASVPARYKNVMRRIITDRYDVERGEVVTGTIATRLPNSVQRELKALKVPRI